MSAEEQLVTVRLGWDEVIAFRSDREVREHLAKMGLDPRTMTCRRDDAARQWVYQGKASG